MLKKHLDDLLLDNLPSVKSHYLKEDPGIAILFSRKPKYMTIVMQYFFYQRNILLLMIY